MFHYFLLLSVTTVNLHSLCSVDSPQTKKFVFLHNNSGNKSVTFHDPSLAFDAGGLSMQQILTVKSLYHNYWYLGYHKHEFLWLKLS